MPKYNRKLPKGEADIQYDLESFVEAKNTLSHMIILKIIILQKLY